MRSDSDSDIKRAYFLSLCLEVGTDRKEHDGSWNFMWSLHQKPFFWSVPNDDNRIADGVRLREVFADNMLEDDCPCLDGQCTVLEMLVALALRMEDILAIPNKPSNVHKWFWELIGNLGLDVFDDMDPYQELKIDRNNKILNRFINREYFQDGKGGLFPLRRPKENQRKVEIWYQMMSYLDENYPEI